MRINFPRGTGNTSGGRRMGGNLKVRLLIAFVVALFVIGGYLFNTSTNPITGESQRVGMSEDQEVAMGLTAAPEMEAQFGGPSQDAEAQALVQRVGQRLIAAVHEVYGVNELPWQFSFTLLADDQTVNAFALPGGPTFITEALLARLETEGQLAGVMGHEVGHVIHRHGAERIAKQNLTQGLTQSAVLAAGDMSAGQVAAMVGNFVMMSYGREDELECDAEGIQLMVAAGYDPHAMIDVMRILKEASGGGSGGAPEWASSHPDPDNRAAKLKAMIEELERRGKLPEGLRE